MNIPIDEVRYDVGWVTDRAYRRVELLEGHFAIDSPIFDALAADCFAKEISLADRGVSCYRGTNELRRNHAEEQ